MFISATCGTCEKPRMPSKGPFVRMYSRKNDTVCSHRRYTWPPCETSKNVQTNNRCTILNRHVLRQPVPGHNQIRARSTSANPKRAPRMQALSEASATTAYHAPKRKSEFCEGKIVQTLCMKCVSCTPAARSTIRDRVLGKCVWGYLAYAPPP